MNTKRNIIANVGGRVWQSLMSFAFVPFYIHFMGVEAYGLIGVFTTLLAVFAVLDLGASTTVTRELSRLSGPEGQANARTLTRTLEWIFWGVGVIIAASIAFSAHFIATKWLNVHSLAPEETIRAIKCMAITALLRWPGTLYTGALMGLRSHVTLNLISAFAAALQGLGAVLVLWLVSPSVTAFFTWQIIVAALQIVLLYAETWRRLRLKDHSAEFRWSVLRPVVAFSAGLTGITLMSTILMQLDKLMLSGLVPLKTFGYYTLASAIANVLAAAASAVFGAVLPSLSLLVAEDREEEVVRVYHKGSQLLSVLLMPVAAMIFFFSPELLAAYVHNPQIVKSAHAILSVLVLAFMFNSIMLMPLALQYAFGWTRLVLGTNIVVVIVFIPMLWLLITQFGAIGAAYAWLLVSASYILVMINMMHRRILPDEKMQWYVIDFGRPLVASFSIMGLVRLIMPSGIPLIAGLIVIGTAFGCALVATAAILPTIRIQILRTIFKREENGYA